MSRFGDDDGDWDVPPQLWWQAQALAIHGKKGQQFLRELEQALLALPQKRLIDDYFADSGEVCGLGALAWYRRVQAGEDSNDVLADLSARRRYETDYETIDFMEDEVGMKRALASAIAWANDEHFYGLSPEDRWQKMLEWVREHVVSVTVS